MYFQKLPRLHRWSHIALLTLQMNSMSSLSMSFTTMIFILLRKCRARSLKASLLEGEAQCRVGRRNVLAHMAAAVPPT